MECSTGGLHIVNNIRYGVKRVFGLGTTSITSSCTRVGQRLNIGQMKIQFNRLLLPCLLIVSAVGFWYAGARTADDAGDKTPLTWLVSLGPLKASYETLAASFQQENPDIALRLIWVPAGQYQTKFKTLAAAGLAPDVFNTGDVWVAYMLPFLLDLTDLVARDRDEIDLDDFFPEVVAAMQHKERYYFWPRI